MCPLGLHISLGVFFRLFTPLEDECHELDISYSVELQGSIAGSGFNTFVTALKRQSDLRDSKDRITEQIEGLEQLLTLVVVSLPPNSPQPNTVIQQVMAEITSRKDRKNQIVHLHHKL